ncbi:MAG: class I SAM-dependent methyltransferase [Oscillospiraceae bacterium]
MDFWDRVAGIYDLSEKLNGRVYRELVDMTGKLVPTGAKVLDCAAGTGELSLAAAKKADSVLCTDMSENMLSKAKKKAKAQGQNNITFEKRNIFALPDADETYDVVIAGNVLHLLDNPENAVREIFRVVKKGGRLLLPTFLVKDNALIKAYKLIGFNLSANYTPKTYRKMLENAGVGEVKTKLIKGFIPCCYAVIKK